MCFSQGLRSEDKEETFTGLCRASYCDFGLQKINPAYPQGAGLDLECKAVDSSGRWLAVTQLGIFVGGRREVRRSEGCA